MRWIRLTLLLATLLILSLTLGYQWVYGQRTFLGVRVEGLDLGALEPQQARPLLTSQMEAYSRSLLTLRYADQQWQYTPEELGYRPEIEATMNQAYAVGRSGNPFLRLAEQLAALRGAVIVHPLFRVEGERQQALLATIAQKIDRPAHDAGLQIENLEVRTTLAQRGLRLDREAATRLLQDRFAHLSREPIPLPVVETPPSRLESDLKEAIALTRQMISAPITLHATLKAWEGTVPKSLERTWTLEPRHIGGMIGFREEKGPEGRSRLMPAIDPAKVGTYGAELAKEVEQKPQNARLEWRGGRVVPILPSREGTRLDLESLPKLLEKALLEPGPKRLELPLVVEKPAVALEDLEKMGIKEKIEERSTSYAGSIPERAANVELGAKLLNGIVVPPGQTFSFNHEVGEVSPATGFQMGFSIIESQTVPDAGGGICQVATTLFQSVFWAGYTILERYPHAYRIRRYEEPLPGLDATVYAPSVDLKFKNDQDTYLLIQAWTEKGRIYFALYGTKPRWEVKVGEPVLENVKPADKTIIRETSAAMEKGREVWVEQAEDGVDVRVTRRVIQDGKTLREAEFVSRYRPQRNVLVMGTRE